LDKYNFSSEKKSPKIPKRKKKGLKVRTESGPWPPGVPGLMKPE